MNAVVQIKTPPGCDLAEMSLFMKMTEKWALKIPAPEPCGISKKMSKMS